MNNLRELLEKVNFEDDYINFPEASTQVDINRDYLTPVLSSLPSLLDRVEELEEALKFYAPGVSFNGEFFEDEDEFQSWRERIVSDLGSTAFNTLSRTLLNQKPSPTHTTGGE